MREALRVGKLSYHDNFFSIAMSSQEAKKRLGDELRNFSVITEPSKSHFGKVCIPPPKTNPHHPVAPDDADVRVHIAPVP